MLRLTRFVLLAGVALSLLTTPAAAERVFAGGFTHQVRHVSGSWSIEREDDGTYLVLSNDFGTRWAPDLKLYLSALPAADVKARNAADGLLIGDLPKFHGMQRVRLPDGVDISAYKSVVLHCRAFSALWAAGDIDK